MCIYPALFQCVVTSLQRREDRKWKEKYYKPYYDMKDNIIVLCSEESCEKSNMIGTCSEESVEKMMASIGRYRTRWLLLWLLLLLQDGFIPLVQIPMGKRGWVHKISPIQRDFFLNWRDSIQPKYHSMNNPPFWIVTWEHQVVYPCLLLPWLDIIYLVLPSCKQSRNPHNPNPNPNPNAYMKVANPNAYTKVEPFI